jgi:hypothetical protein
MTAPDGPAPVARATAACWLCDKGIYQAGHDDQNKPYWLHADGYRTCSEDDELAVATPAPKSDRHKENPVTFRPQPRELRAWLDEAAKREGRPAGAIVSASLERYQVLSDAGLALLDRDQTRALGARLKDRSEENGAALNQAIDRMQAAMRAWRPGT